MKPQHVIAVLLIAALLAFYLGWQDGKRALQHNGPVMVIKAR